MNGTDRASRGTGAERDGSGSTPVSPLMIPLLVAGLAIGFLAGYFLLWWGALVVLAVVVAAIVYFLEIWIDNNFARVKWQALLKSAWVVALVAGGVNIAVLAYAPYLM